MKYLISYQCNADGKNFESQFEFEADQQPSQMAPDLLDAALRNSTIFCHSGIFGLTVTKIELISPKEDLHNSRRSVS